jgi:hypothetical protein
VKCGGSRATSSCKETKDTPAKCALCNGPYPTNYKGCEFYHRLAKGPNNVNNRLNIHHKTYSAASNPTNTNKNSTIPTNRNQIPAHIQQNTSYANLVRGNANQKPHIEDNSTTLSKFLEEFKAMFQQLIQQNSMVLNMLISKIR